MRFSGVVATFKHRPMAWIPCGKVVVEESGRAATRRLIVKHTDEQAGIHTTLSLRRRLIVKHTTVRLS